MDVIIYTRVSTEDQKENGFSLQDQERRLRAYCESKGKTIIAHYQDNYSGKNFNRPEFQRMLTAIKNKNLKACQFFCVRADRFSRDLSHTLNMVQTLKTLKVDVRFLEYDFDLSVPENYIPYIINMALPQVENERRGLNTKNGLRQAKREGRWVARAPKGYSNDKINKTVFVNEDTVFIKRAFQEVSLKIKSIDQIRKELNKEGFKCSKQQFYNLLKNPFYIGYIKIDAWKDEEEELVKGLHDPIIEVEIFNQVQEIFQKGKRKDIRPSKYNTKYPLRGYLICNKCGNKLTASSSKGRKKYYSYYHCQNGCTERHQTSLINSTFSDFLRSFSVSEEVIKLYKEIIKDIFKEQKGTKESKILKLNKEIASLDNNLRNLDEKLLSNDIEAEDYNRMGKNTKEKIEESKREIVELKQTDSPLDQHFQFGLSMMKNINYYYDNADIPTKQRIVGSIFPEKLIFDGESYRTTKVNSFISLISSKSVNWNGDKTKQATSYSDLSNMAPPLGLEPRTL